MIALKTKTPWNGRIVGGMYTPTEDEIYLRAEELRKLRSEAVNKGGRKATIPTVTSDDCPKCRGALKLTSSIIRRGIRRVYVKCNRCEFKGTQLKDRTPEKTYTKNCGG